MSHTSHSHQLADGLSLLCSFTRSCIPSSCSYGWSINVLATFYNSTCLVIFVLIWKGTKGQSIITCPSSSQNAQTFKSNLTTFESMYSWSCGLIVYVIWSSSGFPWCGYDYGTSSNTFTCAFAYLDDCR
jgi:hypothetical protein